MMRIYLKYLPVILMLTICLALWRHGPIPQLANYHAFADRSQIAGIEHVFDVSSNVGFLLVGIWVLVRLFRMWRDESQDSLLALSVFGLSIMATAWCSTYYHLSPDNTRLFWDRLPIAVACASLLAIVRAQCFTTEIVSRVELFALVTFALVSVLWWQSTGDLRPYLLLQILAILMPALWQWLYRRPISERRLFGLAVACYVVAKFFEMADFAVLNLTGWLSGHTLKHGLAALAAYFILLAVLPPSQKQVMVKPLKKTAIQRGVFPRILSFFRR